ncbi:hypothetical protein [Rheinheimera salexigens]|uniref:hypothetical protein n=1 Tax=Rheinheimera salexigens TaxID=1628148 RepID=UPI00114CADCB|nr:hypothetical protein [Rheinheimera salexigens]
MDQVEKTIEEAYQAHLAALYQVLSQAILAANGDGEEVSAAEDRYKQGLAHAADVRTRARAAAGIS